MRRESGLFALFVEQNVGVGRLYGAGSELAHVLVVEGVPGTQEYHHMSLVVVVSRLRLTHVELYSVTWHI